MRCLHCGKRVLLRKFSGGEFCSEAHRQQFFDEQQRLALARLVEAEHHMAAASQRREAKQTHSFLPVTVAPRKSGHLASFPAEPLGSNLDIATPLFEQRLPAPQAGPAQRLLPLRARGHRLRPHGGKIRLRAFGICPPQPGLAAPVLHAKIGSTTLGGLGQLERLAGPQTPMRAPAAASRFVAPPAARAIPAPAICLPAARLVPVEPVAPVEQPLPPVCGWMGTAPRSCNLELVPRPGSTIASHAITTPAPPAHRIAAAAAPRLVAACPVLAATGTEAHRGTLVIRQTAQVALVRVPVQRPEASRNGDAAALEMSGPLAFPAHLPQTPPAELLPAIVRPLAVSQTGIRYPEPALPGQAELALAAAQPLPVLNRTRAGAAAGHTSDPSYLNSAPPAVHYAPAAGLAGCSAMLRPATVVMALPPSNPKQPRGGPTLQPDTAPEPVEGTACAPASRRRVAAFPSAIRLKTVPWTGRPRPGRYETVGEAEALASPPAPVYQRPKLTPASFHTGLRMPNLAAAPDEELAELRALVEGRRPRSGRRWLGIRIPPQLTRRRMLVALSAALMITVLMRRPQNETVSAASTTGTSKMDQVLADQWREVQDRILKRAAVNYQDDFRSGLSDWRGKGNWARDWRYDASGFVRTGSLGLYQPSMTLNNYSLEFLGQVERRAMGWVVRAEDFDNYYAMKLVIDRPGPLAQASLVRYAVIRGRETSRTRVPIHIPVQNDSLFRIRVDVRGENFTTSIHGQVVDFWSDRRLSWGGIGFFSGKGEQSRVRWVEVSHQYDMLGRLCAWMAPNGMAPADGGINR